MKIILFVLLALFSAPGNASFIPPASRSCMTFKPAFVLNMADDKVVTVNAAKEEGSKLAERAATEVDPKVTIANVKKESHLENAGGVDLNAEEKMAVARANGIKPTEASDKLPGGDEKLVAKVTSKPDIIKPVEKSSMDAHENLVPKADSKADAPKATSDKTATEAASRTDESSVVKTDATKTDVKPADEKIMARREAPEANVKPYETPESDENLLAKTTPKEPDAQFSDGPKPAAEHPVADTAKPSLKPDASKIEERLRTKTDAPKPDVKQETPKVEEKVVAKAEIPKPTNDVKSEGPTVDDLQLNVEAESGPAAKNAVAQASIDPLQVHENTEQVTTQAKEVGLPSINTMMGNSDTVSKEILDALKAVDRIRTNIASAKVDMESGTLAKEAYIQRLETYASELNAIDQEMQGVIIARASDIDKLNHVLATLEDQGANAAGQKVLSKVGDMALDIASSGLFDFF